MMHSFSADASAKDTVKNCKGKIAQTIKHPSRSAPIRKTGSRIRQTAEPFLPRLPDMEKTFQHT